MEGRRGGKDRRGEEKKTGKKKKSWKEPRRREKKSSFFKLRVGAEPIRVEERWSEAGEEEAVRMRRSTEVGEALRLMAVSAMLDKKKRFPPSAEEEKQDGMSHSSLAAFETHAHTCGCLVTVVTHLNISVSSPLNSATMTGKPTQAGTR